ncbi:MAG: hypothetical protein HYR68_01970, partial [Burkholderiales bacterium]|nr:hypothetical protein [Burkholderiales bacterium]
GLCRWLDIPSPAPLTPIGALLVVAMLAVHPDWSIAEGQFGWLLLIISGIITITITMAGPGAYSLNKGKSA